MEVSSTQGFNDVIVVRDYKKKLVVDECKSAELNPKKRGKNASVLIIM